MTLQDRDSIRSLLNCVHGVRTLYGGLRKRLARISESEGISDSDLLTLLTCVGEKDGVYQRDLAVRIGVSTPQMSAVVERLKRAGLLLDDRAESDRRRVYWSLTAEGLAAVERMSAGVERLTQSLLQAGEAELTQSVSEAARRIEESTENGSGFETSERRAA